MLNNIQVEVQSREGATVLAVSGELDLASSPALQRELERVGQTDAELVIVDLRNLQFLDSTGLHLLVQAHRSAREAGRQFALAGGSDQVQRLLTLTGVAEQMQVVDSPDQLLGHL